MKTNLQPNRPVKSFRTSIIHFQGDDFHRVNDVHAATSGSRFIGAGHSFDASSGIQESIEETFGKTEPDLHTTQLSESMISEFSSNAININSKPRGD